MKRKFDLYDEDNLRQIAIDHYERNRTQLDIAKSYGVSRPSITEALKRARARDIVKFTIPRDRERNLNLNRLHTAMLRKFEILNDVELVVGNIDAEGSFAPNVVPEIAKAAAAYLEAELINRVIKKKNKTRLAVSGGRKYIRQVVQNLSPMTNLPDLEVLPISGFIREQANNGDASLLAYDIATLYKAKYAWLPIPSIVETDEQCTLAKGLPIVRDVLERVDKADIYLLTLFAPYSDELIQRGILKKQQIDKISKNAVCNIDMWFYTLNGKCVNTSTSTPPFYLTGYDINKLQEKVKSDDALVILVAGGKGEIEDGNISTPGHIDGIRAIIKAGLINVLITDHITASALVA